MFKMTGNKLDVISDIDMYKFVEKATSKLHSTKVQESKQ